MAKSAKTKKAKQQKEKQAKEESQAAEENKEEQEAEPVPVVEEDDDDEEEDEDDEEAEGGGTKAPKRKSKANRLNEMENAEEPEEPRGVIYLGHIPRGFEEPEMERFFKQFGKVTRLRLARSKKTAYPKGYAFIEFKEESVAKIVADTMNKYLLFGKQLVCHIFPKEKQHERLFRGCKKQFTNRSRLRLKRHRDNYNERPQVEVDGDVVSQMTYRQADAQRGRAEKLRKKLAEMDVDYDLSEVLGDFSTKIPRPDREKNEKKAPPAEEAKVEAKAEAAEESNVEAKVESQPAKKKRRKNAVAAA